MRVRGTLLRQSNRGVDVWARALAWKFDWHLLGISALLSLGNHSWLWHFGLDRGGNEKGLETIGADVHHHLHVPCTAVYKLLAIRPEVYGSIVSEIFDSIQTLDLD